MELVEQPFWGRLIGRCLEGSLNVLRISASGNLSSCALTDRLIPFGLGGFCFVGTFILSPHTHKRRNQLCQSSCPRIRGLPLALRP